MLKDNISKLLSYKMIKSRLQFKSVPFLWDGYEMSHFKKLRNLRKPFLFFSLAQILRFLTDFTKKFLLRSLIILIGPIRKARISKLL